MENVDANGAILFNDDEDFHAQLNADIGEALAGTQSGDYRVASQARVSLRLLSYLHHLSGAAPGAASNVDLSTLAKADEVTALRQDMVAGVEGLQTRQKALEDNTSAHLDSTEGKVNDLNTSVADLAAKVQDLQTNPGGTFTLDGGRKTAAPIDPSKGNVSDNPDNAPNGTEGVGV